MFVATLVACGVYFMGACGLYVLAKEGGATGPVLAVCLGVLACIVSLVWPILLLQTLVVGFVAFACLYGQVRTARFALVAAGVSGLLVGLAGHSSQRAWSRFQAEYPLRSLAEPLAYEQRPAAVAELATQRAQLGGQANAAQPALPVALRSRLEDFEDSLEWGTHGRGGGRQESLRMVHASYVEQFTTSPGFGVARGPRISPETIPLAAEPAIPQPAADDRAALPADSLGSAELEVADTAPPRLAVRLDSLHADAAVEFLRPERFGYVRDRAHVAGFVPHAMAREPNGRDVPGRPFYPPPQDAPSPDRGWQSRADWLLARLELVSLLKHDSAMVYVSPNLPRMDDLSNVPVRELDAFELGALPRLRAGEDVVHETTESDTRIRLLGSLRAARQCVQCHDVPRGALLGAFSYELRPAIPAKAPPQPRRPDA